MTRLKILVWFVLFTFTLGFSQDALILDSENCKKCHQTIYSQWQKSMHAKSHLDANILYKTVYEQAVQETGGKLKTACLNCHMPSAVENQDWEFENDKNRSGVSCNYCHSVAGLLKTEEHKDFLIDESGTKYGPNPDSDNTFHEISESDTHKSSEFCLICHGQMVNPAGVEVCMTGDEFKNSEAFANAITCQDCHMPQKQGEISSISKVARNIASHTFAGGYSAEFLKESLDLALFRSENGAENEIQVKITNSQSAHSYPTGSILRMVILKITAKDNNGQQLWTNFTEDPVAEDPKAVFMKILADENGNAPVFPWKAKSVKRDSRLKPDEERVLTYEIPEKTSKIEAVLLYRLAPPKIIKKFEITDPQINNSHLITKSEIIL